MLGYSIISKVNIKGADDSFTSSQSRWAMLSILIILQSDQKTHKQWIIGPVSNKAPLFHFTALCAIRADIEDAISDINSKRSSLSLVWTYSSSSTLYEKKIIPGWKALHNQWLLERF